MREIVRCKAAHLARLDIQTSREGIKVSATAPVDGGRMTRRLESIRCAVYNRHRPQTPPLCQTRSHVLSCTPPPELFDGTRRQRWRLNFKCKYKCFFKATDPSPQPPPSPTFKIQNFQFPPCRLFFFAPTNRTNKPLGTALRSAMRRHFKRRPAKKRSEEKSFSQTRI